MSHLMAAGPGWVPRPGGMAARQHRCEATEVTTRRTAARAERFSGPLFKCLNVYIEVPAAVVRTVAFTPLF